MDPTAVVARSSANVIKLSANATQFANYWLSSMEIGVEHELVLLLEKFSAILASVFFSH
jgi:hypothetical protein